MSSLEALRRLADQGDVTTQYRLGAMYARGWGVEQDHAEAAAWWRRAAEQGHTQAQNNIGFMYANGRGIEQDTAEAAIWLRKAAEQGHPEAQNNLGVLYVKGAGVPRDFVQAYMWLELASASYQGRGGDRAAQRREEVATHMTQEQIEKARRLALEWKPKGED